MTAEEWLECNDWQLMLQFLPRKGNDRKIRLFAAACCRAVWPLLVESRSREAVEMSERYADGLVAESEMDRAAHQAYEGSEHLETFCVKGPGLKQAEARWAAAEMAHGAAEGGWYYVYEVAYGASRAAHVPSLIREIFGNPLRPVAVDPDWLRWNDGAIQKMASTIYDDRAFDRLPILADALEDAGCSVGQILNHCRSPAPHVRGCWLLDLLLANE
jgi:hypothetical protein